jgi:hypothetical protein
MATILACLLLLSCNCDTKLGQSEWERYLEIRAETQSYLDDVGQAKLAAAVRGNPIDLQQMDNRYRDLFSARSVELLKRIEEELDDSLAQTQPRRLHLFLTEASLQFLRLNCRQRIPVPVAAKELPLGSRWLAGVPTNILNEDDRNERILQYDHWLNLLHENPDLADRWLVSRDSLLAAHGYHSWADFVEKSTGRAIPDLLACCEKIAVESDSLYLELLNNLAERLGLDSTTELHRLDLARLMTGRESVRLPVKFPVTPLLVDLPRDCDLDSAAATRIREVVGPPEALPTAIPTAPPREVTLVLPPQADRRQVMAAVGAYARAMVYATTESRDFVDVFLTRDFELAAASKYLTIRFAGGDCTGEEVTASASQSDRADFALRQLIELRSLCADIHLGLSWSSGQGTNHDTLLKFHSHALGVDIAVPELAPLLCRSDLVTDFARLRGMLVGFEAVADGQSFADLLLRLRESPPPFNLEHCQAHRVVQVCAALAEER